MASVTNGKSNKGFDVKSNSKSNKRSTNKKFLGRSQVEDHFEKTFEKLENSNTKYYANSKRSGGIVRKNKKIEAPIANSSKNSTKEVHCISPMEETNLRFDRIENKKNWVPSKTAKVCFTCGLNFTFFKRKHHCKIWGKVYCSSWCPRIKRSRFWYTRTCENWMINSKKYQKMIDESKALESKPFKWRIWWISFNILIYHLVTF